MAQCHVLGTVAQDFRGCMSRRPKPTFSCVQKNEGCRLSGKVHVAKVAGRIQLVPGVPFAAQHTAPTFRHVLCLEHELLLSANLGQ